MGIMHFMWTALAVLLCACQPPVIHNAPTPRGLIRGTVVYHGPRPACLREATSGLAVRPVGRVVLTLHRADNPPPPEGRATSAESLLVLPGDALFDAGDCLPASPSLEDAGDRITRSAPFVWPRVTLHDSGYHLRGFFDADGDFAPFYGVRNMVTRGDVQGGALEASSSDRAVYQRIVWDLTDAAARGGIVTGVTVTLSALVSTERPVFELGRGTRPLAAEATLSDHSDRLVRDEELWALARTRLELVGAGDAQYAAAFAAAGVELNHDPLGYAWYVRDVDLNRDGTVDEHPVLGSLGVAWQTPMVVLSRAATEAEARAGVPRVLLFGTPRPSQTEHKRVFWPGIDVTVPPVAVVQLKAGDPSCSVPYVPPGSVANAYASGPVECQKLPTGPYDVTVFHGLAGAVATSTGGFAASSDTHFDLLGGDFAGQAWTIPNDLGPADSSLVGPADGPGDRGSSGVIAQGPAGRFFVEETDSDARPRDGCDEAADEALEPEPGSVVRPTVHRPVPETCCAAVEHLCGVPLCPAVGGRRTSRAADVAEGSGAPRLDCIAFLMPRSCCE